MARSRCGALDRQRHLYANEWRAGWIGPVTLSSDDSMLEGSNQPGTHVFGHRRDTGISPVLAVSELPSEVCRTFEGIHPHLRDTVPLLADGTYRRSNGDSCRWNFDGRTLTLGWYHGIPEYLNTRGPGPFVARSNGSTLRKLALGRE